MLLRAYTSLKFTSIFHAGDLSDKLAEVDGSHNSIKHVSDQVENMKSLRELNLSHNCVDEFPQSFSNLQKLKMLDCKANQLKDKRLKKLVEQDSHKVR